VSAGRAIAHGDASLLRVYFGESDRISGRPASEALLAAAHDAGLAGATLFRGSLGFGANSVVRHPQPFRLSGDLPMVLEVVDDGERIDAFVQALGALLTGGGLITVERVAVLRGGVEGEDRAP
jgi:PII-like signaling protein